MLLTRNMLRGQGKGNVGVGGGHTNPALQVPWLPRICWNMTLEREAIFEVRIKRLAGRRNIRRI